MKIAMVGSGYVGLVSGACFADFGHDGVCIDKDEDKIQRLREGVMPIYEPGLEELIRRSVGKSLAVTPVGRSSSMLMTVGMPTAKVMPWVLTHSKKRLWEKRRAK